MKDCSRARSLSDERLSDADARRVAQIRAGNGEAGREFVHDHYGAIYRYLLSLTGRPDRVEDLTQETFLEGWRCLPTFQGRGSLRSWLYRIAHRQFLRWLSSRQAETGLEEASEAVSADATDWRERVELRDAIDRIPLGEREVVLLHYLEGYTSSEIAEIVGVPARTVRRRLEQAREHLRQELGEDDLRYLNEPLAPMRQWQWLPLDQMRALETRLTLRGDRTEDEMERREFLRQAATGAASLVLAPTEKEVVDGRLIRKVALAFKGTALSDLCDHLRSETGVHLTAGASVAEEKVTLFCKQMPLRDVMRQLSRPFGYAWTRSTRDGAYRYELIQDLRSQLLEEELRNRDRNAALLALEEEIDRYRPYLGLSPDEALSLSQSAPLREKKLLEALGSPGWGALQLYTRLSPQELTALRGGQSFTFSQEPGPGQKPLPPELTRGVLQSLRGWHLVKLEEGFSNTTDATDPRGVPLSAAPEARVMVILRMPQAELGRYELTGLSGFFSPKHLRRKTHILTATVNPLAVGRSPAADQPDNRQANGRWARDPALRRRVTLLPRPSCRLAPAPDASPDEAGEPRITSADVLEALHAATGLPIVADYYTRLHKPELGSARDATLFDAINQVADAMRFRWTREDDWLQFRSASYFYDRIKEVPNRWLSRWSAARRKQGSLSLDDLLEIAQLSDAQLDATEMAEGARACWGLEEWHLACYPIMRPHLRWLAGFTPEQRRKAMSGTGLAFTEMPLAQQPQFLTFSLSDDDMPINSPEEFAEACLRVDYTLPGWHQWGRESLTRWVVPLAAGLEGRRILRPLIRERTREAALQAVRRIDPHVRKALLEAMRRRDPGVTDSPRSVEEDAIFPTRLDLAIAFIPSGMNSRKIRVLQENSMGGYANW